MNDNEKKPVIPEGEADTEKNNDSSEDTKVEVKFDEASRDSNEGKGFDHTDHKADDIDITAALKGDKETEEEPDEELSDLDKELGRIEGIESTSVSLNTDSNDDTADKEDSNKTPEDDGVITSESVDLDPVTTDVTKENALVAAMRQQEKTEKSKKGTARVVTGILALLLVAALGGAAYLYTQTTALADQKSTVETERDQLKTQNTTLKGQQANIQEKAYEQAKKDLEAKVAEENKTPAKVVDEYVTIRELGVRYKRSDVTRNLIYGYTVTSDSVEADSVAFSTTTLARLVQRNGASATYPCAFSGNVPTITRYAKDIPVGNEMASKAGKKLGDAFYVYVAPTGACTTTNAQDITARDAAVKAVYDSLEAIPR